MDKKLHNQYFNTCKNDFLVYFLLWFCKQEGNETEKGKMKLGRKNRGPQKLKRSSCHFGGADRRSLINCISELSRLGNRVSVAIIAVGRVGPLRQRGALWRRPYQHSADWIIKSRPTRF